MIKQSNFLLSVYSLLTLIFIIPGCQQDKNEIRQAVEYQLKLYPESRLQDLYKSFFQDEFGPGHLVENVSFAREYFDLELEEMVSQGRHNAEPCGTGKNFYRVPMDLVKDGIIPEEEYFNAFLESSSSFTTPDVLAWKKQWEEIVSIIEKMDLDLPNFTRDKEALNKWLDQGETMVHHSEAYGKMYDPNYRIMGKAQWERLKAVVSRQSSVVSRQSIPMTTLSPYHLITFNFERIDFRHTPIHHPRWSRNTDNSLL